MSHAPLPPAEAAHRLAHLPHLFFFDSSRSDQTSQSHIAIHPSAWLTGNIFLTENLHTLQQAHQSNKTGALCGIIHYDGSYQFGLFPHIATYHHHTDTWENFSFLTPHLRQPQPFPIPQISPWHAHTTPNDFLLAVEKAKAYIAAGHIYQVNLAQQFSATLPSREHIYPLYLALRQASPAPMSAYIRTPTQEILSSSPETFLQISNKKITTRPIKGTRPRHPNPTTDLHLAHELKNSPKENAELLMITDLLRNDIGKVCEYGSVTVEKLATLETHAQVHHLVSTITGTLTKNHSHLDAIRACLPGGSITGAPKKRACEIIAELEKQPRGAYCGTLCYLAANGQTHTNITIRTLIRENQTLHYHVGAGIVADSDPTQEYQETLTKAEGIKLALQTWLSTPR